MSSNYETRVLLIGIDHYTNAPRTQGARQDVSCLWRVLIEQLQIPPENIVVVSPVALTPQELVGEALTAHTEWMRLAERTTRLSNANRDHLVELLSDLADRMAAGPVQGWVHMSAHGTTTGQLGPANLALCAEDYDPSTGDGLLTFQTLQELFGVGESARKLTLSLDCCWTGPNTTSPSHPVDLDLPYRVIVGTSPNHLARIARIAGIEQGAFSWALVTALSRWTRLQRDGQNALQVTFGDLIIVIRSLLVAIGSDQVPILTGPRSVDQTLLFSPTPTPTSELMARQTPNLYMPSRQLWAGEGDVTFYEFGWIQDGVVHPLGVVTVDATQPPGKEIWDFHGPTLWKMLSAASNHKPGTISITRGSQSSSPGPQTVSWQVLQQLAPILAGPDATIDASVLFGHNGPTQQALVALDFVRSESGFTIQTIQWATSALTTPFTFDPVHGQSPTLYTGATGIQNLAADDWVWPAQVVNQWVQQPKD